MVVTERVSKRVTAKRDWLWLVHPCRKQENQNKQKPSGATHLFVLPFVFLNNGQTEETKGLTNMIVNVGVKNLHGKIVKGLGDEFCVLFCSQAKVVIYPELLVRCHLSLQAN